MALPGFTATASCERTPRGYASGRRADGTRRRAGAISPAEFNCDQYAGGTVCTCDGIDNCIHMFGTGTCSAAAQCDAGLGPGHPVCGCIAN
ncbi:MAG: hypothetical protein JHC95_12330 [Solirubrobacteraceae bacterium]|nr:hypothetical protein [Solirubrobacteraceae bacterium]